MSITDEQIAEWRALQKAATPGPWNAPPKKYSETARGFDVNRPPMKPGDGGNLIAEVPWQADARYIAAACNAVPALLDEIERLRAELQAHVKEPPK